MYNACPVTGSNPPISPCQPVASSRTVDPALRSRTYACERFEALVEYPTSAPETNGSYCSPEPPITFSGTAMAATELTSTRMIPAKIATPSFPHGAFVGPDVLLFIRSSPISRGHLTAIWAEDRATVVVLSLRVNPQPSGHIIHVKQRQIAAWLRTPERCSASPPSRSGRTRAESWSSETVTLGGVCARARFARSMGSALDRTYPDIAPAWPDDRFDAFFMIMDDVIRRVGRANL